MIGKSISHYNIIKKIGEDGMGEVFRAEDTKLKRFVVLKLLAREFTQNEDRNAKLRKDARTVSAMKHRNIGTIHEINELPDGQYFIVMEYYEGDSLRDKMRQSILSETEIFDIAIQIASGLQKAHAKGVIHQDINPGKIIITKEGLVKIMDFGLARLKDPANQSQIRTSKESVTYMSPEQLQSGKIDQQTDIWALGVLLYEMLTGSPPFKGNDMTAVIFSVLNEAPASVKNFISLKSKVLYQIILKALTKNKENRYQKIGKVLNDLKNLQAGYDISIPHPDSQFLKKKTFWKRIFGRR